MKKQKGISLTAVLIILLVGIALSAGFGFSMKKTNEAEFCGSCHVMYEAVRTHKKSVHAELACNDCHIPDTPVSKYTFKAYAGMKDMYKNTFAEIHDVIHATDSTQSVVNDNCLRCHTMTTLNVEVMTVKENCTDCHRQVPHLSKLPIAERRVADE
ncbi:MAG: cytochrome c3 family protein [Desulfonatronovibrio sp.]